MLGTDALFMEPARLLASRGAEIILHPTSGPHTPDDVRFLYLNSMDNGIDIATAAYADTRAGEARDGLVGSAGLPSVQAASYDTACYWASSSDGGMGTAAADPAAERPCALFGAREGGPLLYRVNLNSIRSGRVPGTNKWEVPPEQSRRTFAYRHLCYADAAAAYARRAAELVAARGPDVKGAKVRVAMLQMRGVVVEPDVSNPRADPNAAHTAKAEAYVRHAAARGAQIVVMPEQWSVGYDTNFASSRYHDGDSATMAYESYLSWAQPLDGPFVSAMRALARELGVSIAAPYLEAVAPDGAEPPLNSVAVIDRHGELVYDYSKV